MFCVISAAKATAVTGDAITGVVMGIMSGLSLPVSGSKESG